MTQPLVYTIREAAARAGIPVAFVRRMVKDGCIYTVKSGNRYYINWASMERYLLGESDPTDTVRKHA